MPCDVALVAPLAGCALLAAGAIGGGVSQYCDVFGNCLLLRDQVGMLRIHGPVPGGGGPAHTRSGGAEDLPKAEVSEVASLRYCNMKFWRMSLMGLGCVETLCRKCRSVAVLVVWR